MLGRHLGVVTSPDVDRLLEHATWVRSLALQLCRDAQQAEDTAQEAWVRAAQHPPQRLECMRSYLARIVRNLLHHEARSSRRRASREQAVAALQQAVTTDPVELAARAELHGQLVAEVLQLPSAHRQLVLLHYFEGLQIGEVAARTGKSPDAVRAVLRRARDELRQRLERRGAKPALLALTTLAPTTLVALTTMKLKLAIATVAAVVLCWFALPALFTADSPEPDAPPTEIASEHASVELRDASLPADRTLAPPIGVTLAGHLAGNDQRLPWTAPITIAARWRRGADAVAHVTTLDVAANGTFSLHLPQWQTGCDALQLHATGTDAWYEPLDATIAPAAAAAPLQLRVHAAPVALGRIVDDRGSVIAGATVWCFPANVGVPQAPRLGELRSDVQGRWRLRLPANGELLVAVLPTASQEGAIPTGFAATVDGHTDLGTQVLPRAAHITGTVMWANGTAVLNADVEWRTRAAVTLDRATGLGWNDGHLVQRRTASTDANGAFTLLAREGEAGSVLLARAAGCLPATMQTVRATAPQHVEVTVQGSPITIRVLRDGQPAGLSGIEWRRERFAGNYGTDKEGVLRQLVLDEPLRLRAISPDRQLASEWLAFEHGIPAELVLHLLPVDGELVGVRLQGAELSGVGFSWVPKVGDGGRRSVTLTASDGLFVMRIARGSHRLRLHRVIGQPAEFLLPTEVDIDVPSTGDLVVPVRLGGRLRLSITDAQGQFLAGSFKLVQGGVDVVPPGFGERDRTANASRSLPAGAQHDSDIYEPGAYELVVDLGDRGEHRRAVTIVAGETHDVRIVLP